ncbi:MAG: acetate--CoA ligase family protein, partial [Alphaproteobacteria bacterium]
QIVDGARPRPSGEPLVDPRALSANAPGNMADDKALELLRAYGVPRVEGRTIAAEAQVAAAARTIGFPVALKGLVPGVAHKTERGLVRLGLACEREAEAAAAEMRTREPALVGFRVEPMIADGIEMLAGVKSDVTIGPAVVLGFGGIYAEAMGPPAVELAPLDERLAREMIERADPRGVLAGYRTGRALDRGALAALLVALGRLAWDHRARLAAVDLNPVIVRESGVLALDALVLVR